MSTVPLTKRVGRFGRILRYGAGSVVATVCSEATFLLLYGVAHTGTVTASVLAWLAGAVPNYWMNRRWAWGVRGRPRLRQEVLPYVAVVLATLGLATLTTTAADHLLRRSDASAATKSLLVGAVFLLTYALVFVIRFFLFERLFAGAAGRAEPVQPAQPAEPVRPVRPVQPVQPAQPAQPAQPGVDDGPAAGHGTGAFSQATGRSLEDSSGASLRRYRAFQLDLISRECGDTVLEVGAGLGEFASQFQGLRRLVVTDLDPDCVHSMATRFADRPEVEARVLDLDRLQDDSLGEPVSTVVMINVLEHIEDDAGALRSLATLVQPGGSIVIWVPGYMRLYGDFDRRVGHVRRYTPDTLRAAIEAAGLTCRDVRPVNLLGGIAWWLTMRRGGVGEPRGWMHRVYDATVVPATRVLESRVRPPFGQTVLAVATVSS